MKSALILVSSFLLVAAVHGSVLLETRADNDNKDQGKGNDPQNPQGGNGTFFNSLELQPFLVSPIVVSSKRMC
jgi:hypothetical protein